MTLPRHDPGVSSESEGIPDLGDYTPSLPRGEDPELESVPGDDPSAVEDFGTTSEEIFEGESLDGRLAREEPEATSAARGVDDAGGRSAEELPVTIEGDEA